VNKLFSLFLALFGLGGDVITVTSGTVGSAGNVAAELITFMSAKMLEVAEFRLVFDQFGEKHPLPSNSSKTIRFTREEKLAVSTALLTEGVTPDSIGISINQYEATAEQYGQVIILTDIVELTTSHNVTEKTLQLMGLQAAETYDQLVFNVLEAGVTHIYRPNSRANDAALIGSDHITYNDLIQVNAILPGWIDTELTQNARREVQGLHDRVLARTPADRWGMPDDLSGIAVFLGGPASDFVTGTAIPVDGGYSIQG